MAFLDDGHKILKLFGVETERCREATIHFAPGCPVTIELQYYANEPDIEELACEVKRFKLIRETET